MVDNRAIALAGKILHWRCDRNQGGGGNWETVPA